MAHKNKTHSGARKRFKVTCTGKIMRQHAGAAHILSKKTSKRKRKLRSSVEVAKADQKNLGRLLGK